jgi:WD40 repeat protein/class 3 adenylate cyclase
MQKLAGSRDKAGQHLPIEIPSGTVTFLFTDIESSTQLLERLHENYATLLEDHHRLLRAAFASWNGFEIDNQGDSFFAAFPRAVDAVMCVIETQRTLTEHTWPHGVTVKVRMGLHTGEPILARTGYVGMDIHRAARIASSGYGGQVLVSQTTRDLIFQDLPAGISLKDLGEYRLKDIRFPQQIYQLVIEGLENEFPSLRTHSTELVPPSPGEAPYMGLRFFDESKAGWFFGRQQVSTRLAEAVRQQRFLSVIGASGSGKSSIVRAGVVPILQRNQGDDWIIHTITPTAHPLEALSVSLTRTSHSITSTAQLMDDMKSDKRSFHLFVKRSVDASSSMRFLLIIDQFEELFTLCKDEAERRSFIDNFVFAVEAQDGPVTVIITVRADFYEHLAQYDRLREWVSKHQVYIGAMSITELRQVIEEPAKNGGWELAPGLVDLMLYDVGASGDRLPEPGALPLLSHALLETWKRRRGNLMDLSAYTEAGGVRGAIARTAEHIFYQELNTEQQFIARNIFMRLTELGEGTQDTRRRATIEELVPVDTQGDPRMIEQVLVKLADARLITTEKGTVEVAHEALIREWPTLREWLAENRDGLRMQRALNNAAAEWKAANRDSSFLLTGTRLEQFDEWAKETTITLATDEAAFLQTSIDQRQRQRAEETERTSREAALERRSRLFLRSLVTIFALAAITAVMLSIYAFRQSRLATSRELAASAISNLDVDPERSILLAIEALRIEPLWEAQSALHQAMYASHLRDTVIGHESPVLGLAVSPDGKRIASISQSGELKIWGVETAQITDLPLSTLTIRAEFSWTGADFGDPLAFSPNSQHLGTFGENNTAILIDVESLEKTHIFSGHSKALTSLVFSPDGKRLVTTSIDGSAKVWDISSQQLLFQFKENFGIMMTASFSPDGKMLVTGGADAIARVWNLNGNSKSKPGTLLAELKGNIDEYSIVALSFSPDGSLLAIATDNNYRIWDLEGLSSGNLPKFSATSPRQLGTLNQLFFTHNGRWLITVNNSGSTKIWDAVSGEMYKQLFPTIRNNSSALSADGNTLFTGHEDGKILTWDITTLGNGEWARLPGQNAWYNTKTQQILTESNIDDQRGVREYTWWTIQEEGPRIQSRHTTEFGMQIFESAIDQNLTRLAYTTENGRGKIFDAKDGRLVSSFNIPNAVTVQFLRFNLDGSLLISGDTSSNIGIYNPENGELVSSFQSSSSLIDAAVSPDGDIVATVDYWEPVVTFWETSSGRKIRDLHGHSGKISCVVFTPDGKHLMTCSTDGSVKVWETKTGQFVREFSELPGAPLYLSISPDGRLIALGFSNQQTSLINTESQQEIFTLPGLGVSFLQDGHRLLLGSTEEEVIYGFTLGVEELIELSKTRLTRGLTATECQKYLRQRTCPSDH